MIGTGPDRPPIHLVVPGPIDTLTGGFIYDRHMAGALRQAGRLGDLICLEGAYPHPDPGHLQAAALRLAGLCGRGALVIDGLALTALSGHDGAIPGDPVLVALIHHLLGDETGLTPEGASALLDAERRAIERAAGCIVTSPSTARRLASLGQCSDRIRVVIPGLDQPVAKPPQDRRSDQPLRLLCVASLSPRKGQDTLLTALARLVDLDWCLELVGGVRDRDCAAKLHDMTTRLGLSDRVRFCGEVSAEQRDEQYRAADIFVLPSHHEGFGMALSEAMAHGLPIISTLAGAIPETVPQDAGALHVPGDAATLAAILRRFLSDAAARQRAGIAARTTARALPSWPVAGQAFIEAVDALVEAR